MCRFLIYSFTLSILYVYPSGAYAPNISRKLEPFSFIPTHIDTGKNTQHSSFEVYGRLTRELYKTIRRRIIQNNETPEKQKARLDKIERSRRDGLLLGPKTAYNIYMVLDPIPADEIKQRFKYIAQKLINIGAENTNVYYYGVKKLAKPLKKKHEASFISFELCIYPSLIRHIQNKLKQEDHVLRVLVLRDIDKDKERRIYRDNKLHTFNIPFDKQTSRNLRTNEVVQGLVMSNIRSFGDFADGGSSQPYTFAGGHNSAIGLEEGHTVHLYSGGFTVDDGPFRPLDQPENALFLSAVKNGVAPPEFQNEGKDVRVYFIDDSHRKYEPPTSDSSSTSASNKTTSKSEVENISIASGFGSTTTLRIKLHDNRQINLTVPTSATLGELRSLMAEKSGLSPSSFRILYGFPPREMKGDDSETLNDNDLSGCAIIQHLIN